MTINLGLVVLQVVSGTCFWYPYFLFTGAGEVCQVPFARCLYSLSAGVSGRWCVRIVGFDI